MKIRVTAIALSAVMLVAASVPFFGVGTADAHPNHRSCAGGAAALKGGELPIGPGNNGVGDVASGEAQNGGLADEVVDLHNVLCEPA